MVKVKIQQNDVGPQSRFGYRFAASGCMCDDRQARVSCK
jgi:hypothetical protein